jgi:hypothetical protein
MKLDLKVCFVESNARRGQKRPYQPRRCDSLLSVYWFDNIRFVIHPTRSLGKPLPSPSVMLSM